MMICRGLEVPRDFGDDRCTRGTRGSEVLEVPVMTDDKAPPALQESSHPHISKSENKLKMRRIFDNTLLLFLMFSENFIEAAAAGPLETIYKDTISEKMSVEIYYIDRAKVFFRSQVSEKTIKTYCLEGGGASVYLKVNAVQYEHILSRLRKIKVKPIHPDSRNDILLLVTFNNKDIVKHKIVEGLFTEIDGKAYRNPKELFELFLAIIEAEKKK